MAADVRAPGGGEDRPRPPCPLRRVCWRAT